MTAHLEAEDRRRALTLPAEPEAVAEARAWIADVAHGLLATERLGDLRLVTTEIVTNAIRHGARPGSVLLAATPKDGYLCVQVTDEGAGLVPSPGAMGSDAHGGFGLFIVEQLTRRWGVTREDRRTRVWFEFDYRSA